MMRARVLLALAGGWMTASLLIAQAVPTAAPVSVMVVGTFHMSNPGHDLHNVEAGDVLQPRAQEQIAAVVDSIARFGPTKVMVEWPADLTMERYAQFLAGTLPASHNEVVQLGFRLAKQTGLKRVYGIDVDGDFPYEPVEAFAKAHGRTAMLEADNKETEQMTQKQTELLRTQGIGATLRYLNDREHAEKDNGFYRRMLFQGAGSEQPGAELLTAWYRRNFMICANVLQASEPGDRVVIFYGAGHAFLLRQCVEETPGFRLVEPNGYLPQ